jgi:NodT family efflux transporter outer membrane factor (OMF) lipoprotein
MMFSKRIPGGRPLRLFLLAGAATAATACATVPDLGTAPKAKESADYAAEKSLSSKAIDWPTDRWWTAYGDPQLDDLIDEALSGAPSLIQAEARVSQAQAFAKQAGAALLPQVSAQGAISASKQSYNLGVPRDFVPQGWNDVGSFAGALDWQLDFFGRNRALLAAAASSAEAARAEAAAARLSLSTAVATAYGDLAKLHADRDAATEAVRVRAESEALIAQRAAHGLETEAALERARAGKAAAEAELEANDEAIGLIRNGIAALLGQGPDRGLAIDRPRPEAIRADGLPENLRADLIGRRPDIAAARLTAEAARQRVKAAKADFYPNVNLTAVIGEQSLSVDKLVKSGSMFGAIGPAVSLPIFSAGRIEGAYRGAFADYERAVANYDATVARAFKEVADSAVSARALGARLGKSHEALAASKRAYELMRLRYDRGLATYLDVLSAEDALIANRRSVAELDTRAFILDVALIRALGGGYGV